MGTVTERQRIGKRIESATQPALERLIGERTSSEQDELRERLRADARASLYFLAKGVLQYDKLTSHLHREVCDWVQDLSKPRKLQLLPRGHYKTTIATKAFAVWLTLQEQVPWAGVAGNELRILLSNESATNAEKFLLEIEGHWDRNAILRWLFPELLPDKRKHGSKWSEKAMTLRREGHWSEATIETIGVGGAAQSRHYDVQIKDDLIGKEAMESEEVMRKTITWFDYADSLFISPERGIDVISGTRWGQFDLYQYIIDHDGRYDVYIRQAVEDGKPIFPEEFSLQGLSFLRERNFAHYSSQYLNDPRDPDRVDFRDSWLRRYKLKLDAAREPYIACGEERTYLRDLDIVMVFDPSMDEKPSAARRALAVLGMSPRGNALVLQTYASRKPITEVIEKSFELYAKWHPRMLGVETVGNQGYLVELYRKEMEQRRREGRRPDYINIIPLKTSTKISKESRIRDSIQRFGAMGALWIGEDCAEFLEEYPYFPMSKTKDVLDAVAYALEELRRPYSTEEVEEGECEEELFLESMSAVTGY